MTTKRRVRRRRKAMKRTCLDQMKRQVRKKKVNQIMLPRLNNESNPLN